MKTLQSRQKQETQGTTVAFKPMMVSLVGHHIQTTAVSDVSSCLFPLDIDWLKSWSHD